MFRFLQVAAAVIAISLFKRTKFCFLDSDFQSDFVMVVSEGSIYGLRFIPEMEDELAIVVKILALSLHPPDRVLSLYPEKYFSIYAKRDERSARKNRNGYWQRLSARKSKNGSVLRKELQMGWDLC